MGSLTLQGLFRGATRDYGRPSRPCQVVRFEGYSATGFLRASILCQRVLSAYIVEECTCHPKPYKLVSYNPLIIGSNP